MTFTLRGWELSHAQGLEHIQPKIQWISLCCSCCMCPEQAFLSGPHQSPLCKVIALMMGALYGLLLTNKSISVNTSEHKAQSSRNLSPMNLSEIYDLLVFPHVHCSLTFPFCSLSFYLFPCHLKWFSQFVLHFFSITARLVKQNDLR